MFNRQALAALDFNGRGYVTLADFMGSDPVRRAQQPDTKFAPITADQIYSYLTEDKLFDVTNPDS
jgi:hypothetical protein